MLRYQDWTVTKKFLASIVVVLFCGALLLVVLLGISQKSALMHSLEEKGKNTALFLSAISVEPILSYNFTYLHSYVKDISRDREVTTAVILDKQGNPLARYGGDGAAETDVVVFASPVMQGTEQIGTVRLEFTKRYIIASIVKAQAITAALCVGAGAVILAVVSLLFRRIIVRPLAALTVTMERLATGDLGATGAA
jgi:methyl-accepting chemotaxis protein